MLRLNLVAMIRIEWVEPLLFREQEEETDLRRSHGELSTVENGGQKSVATSGTNNSILGSRRAPQNSAQLQ